MKNIIKIISIAIFTISCKAQSPIINLENRPSENIAGAYYKDTNNLLDQFEGIYKLNVDPFRTFPGSELVIHLKKKTMVFNNVYYEDMLVGEYKYTYNGIVKIDKLNEMNLAYPFEGNHSIGRSSILKNGDYLCNNCNSDEIRIYAGLVENSTNNIANILISKIIVNGQPAIKLWIGWQTRAKIINETFLNATIPGGEYILIKQ